MWPAKTCIVLPEGTVARREAEAQQSAQSMLLIRKRRLARTLPHPDGRVSAPCDKDGTLGMPRHALGGSGATLVSWVISDGLLLRLKRYER